MKETNSGRKQYKTEHHLRCMMKSLMVVSGWILCAAAFVAGGLTVLGISGKYNLKQQTMSYAASAGMPVEAQTARAFNKAFSTEVSPVSSTSPKNPASLADMTFHSHRIARISVSLCALPVAATTVFSIQFTSKGTISNRFTSTSP